MANGVTGVRGAGAVGATRDIVELRRAVERGRTFGPRFVASGTFTHGLPKSRATYVAIDSPQEMRAEVRQRTRTALALHECVYSTLPQCIRGGRRRITAPRHTTHRACAARDHGGQGVGCGKAEYRTRLPASHALCNGRRRDRTTTAGCVMGEVLAWRTRMALGAGMIQGQYRYDERGANSIFTMREREFASRLPMPGVVPLGGIATREHHSGAIPRSTAGDGNGRRWQAGRRGIAGREFAG